MATNKHATIRYHALDNCFSNPGKKYFIDDLIEECNNALYEFTGTSEGIKRRQFFEDIKFMESEQGWSIPLERYKEGRKVYYRYSDKKFSIKNQAINETEASQLKEVLYIFNRFKGMPQFEWMEEILIRIESAFNLKGNNKTIVDFEQNPYLKGLNHFTELFNAIQYKKVLSAKYKSFKQTKPVNITLHPYFLKQYNNRWFLFGYNEEQQSISNLALDRITKIKEVNKRYIENEFVNFEEYFFDIIGVTVKENQKPVKVLLRISNSLWPYIDSKPLHGSQKVKSKDAESVLIEMKLQLNYELISLIFSFGNDIIVLAPEELKKIIKSKANALLKNYL